MPLLDIHDLSVSFTTRSGIVQAADAVTFTIEPGETVGIVGESGSGKSASLLAIMGLLPPTALVSAARAAFDDRELLNLDEGARSRINGRDVAMIFQEPLTSLNPCFTVGFQIIETLAAHDGAPAAERRKRAAELLRVVGIADPARTLARFPHQLSGGMNQRVMIAMAIANRPRLLLADEPTTALDVTIQAQILDLLAELRATHGMAMVLVSHDLGVVAEVSDRIEVMYAGQQVESGPTAAVLASPRHPYTAALLAALPERSAGSDRLASIPGVVPSLAPPPPGCRFAARCTFATARCTTEAPALLRAGGRAVRCHFPLAVAGGSGS